MRTNDNTKHVVPSLGIPEFINTPVYIAYDVPTLCIIHKKGERSQNITMFPASFQIFNTLSFEIDTLWWKINTDFSHLHATPQRKIH
jgi:hypothetical protein